jgi:hypothetical protein
MLIYNKWIYKGIKDMKLTGKSKYKHKSKNYNTESMACKQLISLV